MRLLTVQLVSVMMLVPALTAASSASSQVVDSEDFAQRIAFCEQRSKYVAKMIDMKRSDVSALDVFKEIQAFDSSHYEYLITALRRIWNQPWGNLHGQTVDEQAAEYLDHVVIACVREIIPEPASE